MKYMGSLDDYIQNELTLLLVEIVNESFVKEEAIEAKYQNLYDNIKYRTRPRQKVNKKMTKLTSTSTPTEEQRTHYY